LFAARIEPMLISKLDT